MIRPPLCNESTVEPEGADINVTNDSAVSPTANPLYEDCPMQNGIGQCRSGLDAEGLFKFRRVDAGKADPIGADDDGVSVDNPFNTTGE